VLASLPDCSVDSVVTDPPYELGFMGKSWDASGVAYSVELWAEVLRVLKPGGHLCAFGGTRTYHRMAVAIEDAGFEIRDSLHWVYGSGFPKSLDVSKAIDKAAGAEREVVGPYVAPDGNTRNSNLPDSYYGKNAQKAAGYRKGEGLYPSEIGLKTVTTAATDAAKRWSGWGTALKPAHEPIVLARKPLTGTVTANVLEHGTGALNIDGARVGIDGGTSGGVGGGSFRFHGFTSLAELQRAASNGEKCPDGRDAAITLARYEESVRNAGEITATGRWPANVIFDTKAGAVLDEQSGTIKGQVGMKKTHGGHRFISGDLDSVQKFDHGTTDSGGASRFFTSIDWHPEIDVPFRYVPKPGKRERNAGLDGLPERDVHRFGAGIGEGLDPRAPSVDTNHHPTVKPLALMRWLVRLVTPPGGTVLEPFAGSGTTLMACVLEGFNGIGIEMTDEYLPIIDGRVKWAREEAQREAEAKASESAQESLF
jgi:site-specific DNA-methyltransferase (adenine-specific)